jgi:hypothetical protein
MKILFFICLYYLVFLKIKNMKHPYLAVSLIFVAVVLISSCLKEKSKTVPVIATPPVALGACDTITYTKHIKSIIDLNCAFAGCHVAGGVSPTLTTYSEVSAIAGANGKLKLRVITLQTMPASAPLSAPDIAKIQCWIDNGAKQ